ncbi:MAG: hypothetical protein NC453_27735, partial [Muribaculum sp.]|nr:hypothetical protein [Muribaculum sp.]
GSRVGLSFNGTWRSVRSEKENFMPIDARDLNYGLTALVKMPFKFELSTDLTLFTRRGYNDSALNTTNWVWNARLSYTCGRGGNWLLMVDGFDILHNLSNVQYSVNAQGRTETYTNVIPRYLMFHLQYKFNILPKRR